MSDEKNQQDETAPDDDEELLSDLQDIFGDDKKDPVDTDITEDLDAFLDDFEMDIDAADAPSAAPAGDAAAAAEPGTSQDLDLDVGLDGEIFSNEITLDEDELGLDDDVLDIDAMMEEATPPVSAAEKLSKKVVPDKVATATKPEPELQPAVAAVTPPASPSSPVYVPAPGLTRPQLLGGIVALSLSLLLSVAALLTGMNLSSQVEVLNQNMTELQQRVLAQAGRGAVPQQAEVGDQVNRLGERVNDLAVIIEGPLSHLRESNQQALALLSSRLDRIESGKGRVAAVTSEKSRVAEPALRKPLVSKPEPAVVRSVVKKAGWVVNLLSVVNVKTANEEMERLRKLGIRADKQTVNKGGKTLYRIRVSGYQSYEAAKASVAALAKQSGVKSAWVGKE